MFNLSRSHIKKLGGIRRQEKIIKNQFNHNSELTAACSKLSRPTYIQKNDVRYVYLLPKFKI